ncbi:MAG TPA: ribosome maturation factor RimM [Desulfatirhabdiaceae bacterium]|nr:ribosome maturation factor RimM [Desulfatirhabdiaceae bacterium]
MNRFSAPMKNDGWVEIGHIAGVHGIRGILRIHAYCDDETFISNIPSIRIETPQGHASAYDIQLIKRHGRSLLCHLKGITDRNQAEEIVGSKLYCKKKCLPQLEEDIYYWVDLIGLEVYTMDDELIGLLSSIIPTAGNDVFVVRLNDRETLIPAIESVIQEIDLTENRMRVNLPEGLRD